MNAFHITLLVVGSTTLYLAAAWLDSRKNWKLVDWFNGKTSNPFIADEAQKAQAAINTKDKEIKELKERIQVLEKIVTEPAYELNKKINAL